MPTEAEQLNALADALRNAHRSESASSEDYLPYLYSNPYFQELDENEKLKYIRYVQLGPISFKPGNLENFLREQSDIKWLPDHKTANNFLFYSQSQHDRSENIESAIEQEPLSNQLTPDVEAMLDRTIIKARPQIAIELEIKSFQEAEESFLKGYLFSAALGRIALIFLSQLYINVFSQGYLTDNTRLVLWVLSSTYFSIELTLLISTKMRDI